MGLRIKTNTSSIQAQNQLAKTTDAVKESMAKLASGKRINKAADDAAGLAISENLRADIRGLQQAKRNANDGIALIQVAESGLTETNNVLVRLRELSIQAASDTVGRTERQFIDKEVLQLKDEIDRITNTTEFNGTLLLSGDNEVPEEMRFEAREFPLEIQVNKNFFSESDGEDKSNPINIIRLDFAQINSYTHGDGSLELGQGEEGVRVIDKESAQMSVGRIDRALEKVNNHRAYLGAVQNRLSSTISNLGMQIDTQMDAKSRIVDTDFAEETANYTSQNILQQAGSAVLANANAFPQVALSLLT